MKIAAIVFVLVAILASIGVFVVSRGMQLAPSSLAGVTIVPMPSATSSAPMSVEQDSAYASTITMWQERIRALGAQDAYAEFAVSVKGLDPAMQHMQAHLFGAALYRQDGGSGFPVCGNLFSFGCAHALIASAIQVEGVDAVTGFAVSCAKTTWPQMCFHGIGHGLMRASGYTQEAVRKSIRLCIDSVKDISTAGCIGGVIMEYDGQSMTGSVEQVRELTDANTYEPCLSAPREAKSACYFWLVSWWYDDAIKKGTGPVEGFKRLGSLCDALPEREYVPQCLAGEGAMAAAVAAYTVEQSIELCEASSASPESQLYCKAYAGNILQETADGGRGTQALCRSLPEEFVARCTYLARKGVSVFD